MRSFAKAVSYRFFGTMLSCGITYVATQDLRLSGMVGFSELVLKTVAYYAHERVWALVPWGRQEEH